MDTRQEERTVNRLSRAMRAATRQAGRLPAIMERTELSHRLHTRVETLTHRYALATKRFGATGVQ